MHRTKNLVYPVIPSKGFLTGELLRKGLLSGKKIVILLDRLDIYYKEVVQCEKYVATTGGKKPPERSC